MAAAQSVTGVTFAERQVRDILHSIPRVTNFTVQFIYHRELQKNLKIIFPELVVGQERQFNHIVAHHPCVFLLVNFKAVTVATNPFCPVHPTPHDVVTTIASHQSLRHPQPL
jgi:hypothetical protein